MKTRSTRYVVFLLLSTCLGFSIWGGTSIARKLPGGPIDFQAIYFGTACLLHHCNPYNVSELDNFYQTKGGTRPAETAAQHETVTLYVNLPPTFILIAPMTLLPLVAAQAIWMTLTAGGFFLAAFLVWKLASRYSLYLSLFLVGMILANSQLVFLTGNTVGIVISLCVIAVWCFVENRFVPFGVLCLGLSLAVKPHDAGFVWLYFVLVGERYQRRALQALSLTVALGGAALLWVTFVAPHWLQNWLANMKTIAMPGGLNNPGPLSVSINFLGGVIDLQTVFALFKDDPHFYNSLSYLVSGVLLAIWVIHTLRKKFSPMRAWFALAAIAPITLFLTYHRSYDAKLLILTIPACAILWARGGAIKWTALLINFAGLLLTADFPLTILMAWARGMHFPESGILAQLSMAVLMRPAPIILLVMSIFYLWVYSMVTIPKTNSDQERMVSGLSGSKAAQSLAGSN